LPLTNTRGTILQSESILCKESISFFRIIFRSGAENPVWERLAAILHQFRMLQMRGASMTPVYSILQVIDNEADAALSTGHPVKSRKLFFATEQQLQSVKSLLFLISTVTLYLPLTYTICLRLFMQYAD